MSLNDTGGAARRRRGPALEQALLDAAWEELVAHGYDLFTIEGVAARAGTSRAVVYRRWATKPELARAAIGHGVTTTRPPLPDTGTLRADVIEVMRRANATRVRIATLLSVRLGAYYDETGTSLADLRETLVGGHVPQLDTILERAVARGEVDPEKLTPRVRTVPFDLFRHEVLMTLKPVPQAVIEDIVDLVFLPLVRP